MRSSFTCPEANRGDKYRYHMRQNKMKPESESKEVVVWPTVHHPVKMFVTMDTHKAEARSRIFWQPLVICKPTAVIHSYKLEPNLAGEQRGKSRVLTYDISLDAIKERAGSYTHSSRRREEVRDRHRQSKHVQGRESLVTVQYLWNRSDAWLAQASSPKLFSYQSL